MVFNCVTDYDIMRTNRCIFGYFCSKITKISLEGVFSRVVIFWLTLQLDAFHFLNALIATR